MKISQKIKDNWDKAAGALAGNPRFWLMSPSKLCLMKALAPAFEKHASGRLLDVGAGKMPYKNLLLEIGNELEYVSLDVDDRHGADYVGDAQNLPFNDEEFDVIFCSQVLEHVPQPQSALNEFFRVLKSGGRLLLTVPHLGYLHNEPHDYFRFTKYALNHMAGEAGFIPLEIKAIGGLPAFLGGAAATTVVGLTYNIPVIGSAALTVNAWVSKLVFKLDTKIDKKKRFALDYLLIGEKPD